MSINNKHICVLICFNNYEHIVKCFESIKNLPLDFFIIENPSKNSDKIQKYFKEQKLKGYVRFEENITNNAVDIIREDYSPLFQSYEYITFSDCDLFTDSSSSLFSEIYRILEYEEVGVCCTSLCMDNLPNVPDANGWIPNPISIHEDYINVNTGVHFMTMKQKNYSLLYGTKFKDTLMVSLIRSKNLKWVSTKENKSIHLTWDLYYQGNEYYNFKIERGLESLWSHNETSDYIIL
jgi:hypothetical protein